MITKPSVSLKPRVRNLLCRLIALLPPLSMGAQLPPELLRSFEPDQCIESAEFRFSAKLEIGTFDDKAKLVSGDGKLGSGGYYLRQTKGSPYWKNAVASGPADKFYTVRGESADDHWLAASDGTFTVASKSESQGGSSGNTMNRNAKRAKRLLNSLRYFGMFYIDPGTLQIDPVSGTFTANFYDRKITGKIAAEESIVRVTADWDAGTYQTHYDSRITLGPPTRDTLSYTNVTEVTEVLSRACPRSAEAIDSQQLSQRHKKFHKGQDPHPSRKFDLYVP